MFFSPRHAEVPESPFLAAFRGSFTSIMKWKQLDEFWNVLRDRAGDGWYIYCIGEVLPSAPRQADEVEKFIVAIDKLLRDDHDEDYCGIVYVDSKTDPTFVKIFDPNNLGMSCGSSKNPPLPGWTLTLLPPEHLESKRPLPEGRRRWWQGLWA